MPDTIPTFEEFLSTVNWDKDELFTGTDNKVNPEPQPLQDKEIPTFDTYLQGENKKLVSKAPTLTKIKVRSRFGPRIDPITGKSAFHNGVDLPLAQNTPIKSLGSGRVLKTGYDEKGYGNYVDVDYGNGLNIRFGHLTSSDLEPGAEVTPDSLIGLSGSTGKSTGYHLHVRATLNGKPVDPTKYLGGIDNISEAISSDKNITSNPQKVPTFGDVPTFDDYLKQNYTQVETQIEGTDEGTTETKVTNPNLKNEIPLDYVDTNLVPKDKFKTINGPSPLELLASPIYGDVKAVSGLIDVMKNNPEELAKITELIKQGKAAVIKNKNPDRLLKPFSIQVGGFKKEVPDNDTIIETLLYQIDPELVAANRRYKEETGRDIIRFSGTPAYTYQDGLYNFDIQLTGSAARQVNAYARGGKAELDKEVNKINSEREAYVGELSSIDKAVKDRIGNREWMKVLPLFNPVAGMVVNQFTTPDEREQFVRGVEDKFVLGNLQLLHNIEMLGRAAKVSLDKGFDSEEYLKLIEEDRKRQRALNEASELLPKPKTLKENVFASFGSALGDSPKMVLAGRGLPLLVYLEHLQNGNSEAASQAFSMIPMIGAGHLAGELTAENVRLAGYSLASRFIRQLEVRGVQGATMAATDIVMNPSEYLNGAKTLAQFIDKYNLPDNDPNKIRVKDILQKVIERGTPAAATGALFPVGKVQKSIGSFIKPDANFYRDDVIVGPLKRNYQKYGPEITDTSSPYTPSAQVRLGNSGQPVVAANIDAETLATRHNLGRGVVDRLLGYDPDNLLVYRQAIAKNIESYEKKTNYSTAKDTPATGAELSSLKNESEANVQNKKLLALADDILNQYKTTSGQGITNIPIDMLAYNLYKMKQALANKTYLTEGLSTAERVTRENNLRMSIKILDEALPDEVKNITNDNIQAIEMALTGRDKNKTVKDAFKANKGRVVVDYTNDLNIPKSEAESNLLELQKAILNTYDVKPTDPHWAKAELAFNARERLVNKLGTLKDKLKSQKGSVSISGEGFEGEGLGSIHKLGADIVGDLTKIATFHIEDFYRKQIEPTLDKFIERLRGDLGNEITSILTPRQIQNLFNAGQKYYETNNADPFFSPLKQNTLEQYPDNPIPAASAKNLLLKYGTKNEIEWTSGLMDWLDNKERSKERVTKQEVIDYIERNQVKVDETILGNYINIEEDAAYKSLKDELGLLLRDKYDADKNKLRTQEDFDAIEKQQRDIESRISKREEEIERHNNDVGFTKYDLKSYDESMQLELEGGENPREVLLQVPRKIRPLKSYERNELQTLKDRLNGNPSYYDLFSDGERRRQRDYDRITELEKYEEGEEPFSGNHWSQENVVAHFRANERETTDGIKVFHSEEFQSDWNQEGRKEGYKQALNERELKRFKELEDKDVLSKEEEAEYQKLYKRKIQTNDLVPQNPFMENNWKELAFKRFLRMGIELGKDGISWTTARQQQERYGKALEGKEIGIEINSNGRYDLTLRTEDGRIINNDNRLTNLDKEGIARLTNDEIANKLVEIAKPEEEVTLNLGESINFSNKYLDYDTYFVNLAKKIGGRFGAEYKVKQVETSDLGVETGKVNNGDGTFSITINGNVIKDVLGTPLTVPSSIAEATRGAINSVLLNRPKELYVLFNPNGTGGLVPASSLERAEALAKPSNLDYIKVDLPLSKNRVENVHYLEITPSMRDSILKEGQPLYGITDTSKPSPKLEIGIRNKIITRNAWDSARANVIEAINNTSTEKGIVLNTGLNPEAFVDQVKLLFKGINDFKEFSTLAIKQFGKWIEPHLTGLWDLTKQKFRDFNAEERGSWAGLNPFASGKTPSVNQFTNDKTFSKVPKDVLRKSLNSIVLAQLHPNTFGRVYDVIRDIEGITNSSANYILNELKQARNLDEPLRPDVAETLYIGNEEGKTYTDPELLAGDPTKNRPPLNAEQIQAYKNIREAQNKILDIRLGHELHYAYRDLSRAVPGSPEHTQIMGRIAKINAHYNDLKNQGYITLRRNGNIVIEAEDTTYPVGDDRRRVYTHARNNAEARKIEEQWRGLGYANLKVEQLKSDPTYIRHLSVGMTPSAFEDLVIRSGANTNSPQIQEIREAVYSRYNSHAYKLKRDFTRGYERTWENAIHSMDNQMRTYERSYFTNVGRELGMDALNRTTLMNDDYGLYSLSKSYLEDATSPYEVTHIGRLFTKARQFTSVMQLAYDNAQFWMNGYAQPVSQTYSYFARFPEVKGTDAETYFLKAQKLTHQALKEHYWDKKVIFNSDPVYTDLVKRGMSENLLTARMTGELIKDYEGGIANKLISNGFIFNRAGEIVTRLHAFSEAYLIGTEKMGLTGEDLYRFMRRAVDSTQGVGGTGENPFYVRKLGEGGKLIYQFQKFNSMWWENLGMAVKADMNNIGIPSKATGRHLAGLGLFGGIAGLPLTAFSRTLYTVVTGKDPKDEFKKYMKDHDLLENLALYGLPSIPAYTLNTSAEGLSRKVGITFPFLADTMDEWFYGSDSVYDRAAKSLPAVSTISQMSNVFGDASKAIQTKKLSDALVAGEDILPKSLKNITRSIRYGIDNYSNKPIKNRGDNVIVPTDRLSNTDVVGQGIGITPAQITDYYDKKKYEAIKNSSVTKKVRHYEKRIGLNF